MESPRINTTSQQFFALLRAGLGIEVTDGNLFSVREKVDWETLFRMAKEQTITAIIWDGIMSLPENLYPPKTLWYQWLGNVLKIEKSNEYLNTILPEILERAAGAGIRMEDGVMPITLLKGQGTAAVYPNPLHRSPGDVDIYAGNGYKLLEKNLPKMGFRRIGHSTKHAEYEYKGIIVENHRYTALFFCPWLAWRLKKLVVEWFPEELTVRKIGTEETLVAPLWFEALFGVIHFRTHLHLEGVGWRQLCDWWLLKQRLTSEDNKLQTEYARYEKGLHKLKLIRIETLMEELFSILVLQNKNIGDLSPTTLEVYKEMMSGGNFGHYAKDAHNHSFAYQTGFWKGAYNLALHDIRRSKKFFSLFPEEVLFSPLFRIGGYLKRKGK